MLNYVKRQIKELLDTLVTAKADLRAAAEGQDANGLVGLLADAQDAAVAIGNQVEEAEKGSSRTGKQVSEMVSLLEKYCELLWQITQAQDIGGQLQLAGEAWGLLEEVGRLLEAIPEQMAMVFMPYKASMWDCMESVWQAAREDPDCIPFVVPIPYFDLKDEKVAGRHYEGDKFPGYVPVMDYNEFPLEELHPGAIFVHNPFDDCNTVTSVLPQFYSAELKKAADKLVYIPYYITGDGVFVTHRYLPAYENMDYIVTQCERTIASFSSELPREKFLPCGSPIADRVLRLEKEKPAIPEEWKPQLKNGKDFGGSKAVMLNTSISLLMKQRERFLDKIEYLFELAGRKEGITLVWRPHPLLFSSAQSMGEEFAARLSYLEEKFLREKTGVLDKNPDVGVTVALCDAYLGETASSVIHMFGIAGKPRFYTNLQIPEGASGKIPAGQCSDGAAYMGGMPGAAGGAQEEGGKRDRKAGGTYNRENHQVLASAWCREGNREYYVLDHWGWIVGREAGSGKFKPVVKIPGREVVWGRAYRGMEMKGESLWIYPENAEGTFIYHTKTGRMRKAFGAAPEEEGSCICGELLLLEIDDACLSRIRAEKFKQGNGSHVWNENEKNTIDDFFRFLQTAGEDRLAGNHWEYSAWLENLDGSCGKKVLQAVKEGIMGEKGSQAV